ncbi:membrane protein insertase YidC [Nocardioides nematodiphilus]|uniref:membrane protein insertase YidC n=1 Tax=Nocardioides nematodiphilus TaxID=2849669 RepID=UPI001CDA01C6|nr:membrane protein insertase YidC [Nocardioides nematodiphilus]MCA1984377.1 membrane protein insertase YidC [Nocardioides nematodiphilus]
MGDFFSAIATPLYYAISGILLFWHRVVTLVLSPENGWSWVLAIVGLTVTIRALLIPLFVKQIKSSRNMQLIQPKVKELQKKYGHDRERLAQETMKLYKDTGTNPFASCLPLLIQMPIFLVLFRLVNKAAHNEAKGFLSVADVHHFADAKIFGARLADTFNGTHDTSVRVLAAVLVVAMCATTFFTQRQLMAKNMPAEAMQGQYAQQQKILLYVLPFVFAISGIAFPIAAMLYWTTSNVWTMGQQFYVIRNSPAPGTPAEKAKLERDREKAARKAARHGGTVASVDSADVAEAPAADDRRPAARQQPKKQTRSQRKSK